MSIELKKVIENFESISIRTNIDIVSSLLVEIVLNFNV